MLTWPTSPRLVAAHGQLRSVAWKDLLHLNMFEVVRELLISVPWLAASWIAASSQRYALALICSFMFFLAGLRQVHNAYHYALGLPRAATEWVMFALSILMLGSMHAVQVNHLRHHRYCMGEEDVEAMSARMPAWRAIVIGLLFPLRLHQKALQVGTRRQRRWILTELLANGAWIALVFLGLGQSWLRYHVMAMGAGQCLTGFFAVWTVHHDCDRDGVAFARTIRRRTMAVMTYNMFFNVEHHLFPAVPTCRLPTLAKRVDAVAPQFTVKKVL